MTQIVGIEVLKIRKKKQNTQVSYRVVDNLSDIKPVSAVPQQAAGKKKAGKPTATARPKAANPTASRLAPLRHVSVPQTGGPSFTHRD